MSRLQRTARPVSCRLFVLVAIGMLVLSSCGKVPLWQPIMEKSKDSPRKYNISLDKLKSYQLSKLQDGYSLFLFSFEIVADIGDNSSERSELASGLRAWESRFSETDPDTASKLGFIPLFKKSDKNMRHPYDLVRGAGHLGALFSSSTAQYEGHEFRLTYHKGRICYGGRIMIDATAGPQGFRVEQHFDEDILPILELLREKQPDLEVVISPVSKFVPEINDSWKD